MTEIEIMPNKLKSVYSIVSTYTARLVSAKPFDTEQFIMLQLKFL